MRRAVRAIPIARSAVWTRRLAAAGSMLAVAAAAVPRRGIDAGEAVGLLVFGLLLSMLVLPCAALAAVEIWRSGARGLGRTCAGVLLSLVTLAYPAYLAIKVVRENPDVDLSTDVSDPPRFSSAGAGGTRFDGLTLTGILGRPVRPDIDPVMSDQDPVQAYRVALKIATQLHWRVLAAAVPTSRMPAGRVDAVTYSAVMRLPEDIAIRIAPRDGQTRIDLRSAGRISGLPLVGDDPLKNIQAFADAYESQEAEN